MWLCANFIPHLIIVLATGKVYYQLAPFWQFVAEGSIMLLNLVLPLIALRYSSHQKAHILQSLGWRWGGWRTIRIGLLGFVAFMITAIGTQLIAQPISSPPQRLTPQELILTLILLLGLTAAAEETMFRGYIQTALTQEYGTWIGIGGAALLFGLRHLPMDLIQRACSACPPCSLDFQVATAVHRRPALWDGTPQGKVNLGFMDYARECSDTDCGFGSRCRRTTSMSRVSVRGQTPPNKPLQPNLLSRILLRLVLCSQHLKPSLVSLRQPQGGSAFPLGGT
jgi:membrane protease YdiL (CAAX protease family)